MRVVLLALVAMVSCARLPWQTQLTENCPPPSEMPLSALDSSQRAMLVGSFRLVQVSTADQRERPSERVTPLLLRMADSAERADSQAKRLGNVPRNVEMIGTRDWMAYGYIDQAELDGALLFLGCRTCYDGSPDVLAIHSVGEAGFAGTWVNPQSGITRVVRKDGSLGPNPAGHFCASRIQVNAR